MKNKLAVLAALGCAVFSVSAFSAEGSASTAAVNAIKEGQSSADVIKALGKPLLTLDSEGGLIGLIYQVSDSDAVEPRAFISLDENQKVTGVGFEAGNSESNGADD